MRSSSRARRSWTSVISQTLKTGDGPSQFYDLNAGTYDLERFGCRCGSILNSVELNIIASLVPRGSRVLDAAAGTGRVSIDVARFADQVVALEAAHGMTSRAVLK